jgi:NAD(P)-dependent dehydrogenase (short-subunit alcohol dehydrogenase family)
LSAAADLAQDGHLINAVLPGVLDTPMTRRNLSSDQIAKVAAATKFHRLPSLQSVVSTVLFLCSEDNVDLTGQFITADLGFSNVRFI